MYKFLPSYVGSKSFWLKYLENYKGRNFVEPFAGSGIISANLANKTILNDLDEYVYLILKNFNDLIVPENFSSEDYFNVRSKKDWWKYAYCLQK